jgi:DNA-binding NarL/FixJ family response regulator
MASNEISLNVAIVDDDPIMCEMIKDALKRKYPNLNIEIYNTGEEALGAAGGDPDVVVLDYQLDSVKADAMNGLQVLAKYKERNADLPIIFLSSQDKPEVAANTIKFGAYDYILKTETAFIKLEIAVQNIMQLHTLKKTSVGQKIMNSAFWILLGVIFVYVIVSQFMSH